VELLRTVASWFFLRQYRRPVVFPSPFLWVSLFFRHRSDPHLSRRIALSPPSRACGWSEDLFCTRYPVTVSSYRAEFHLPLVLPAILPVAVSFPRSGFPRIFFFSTTHLSPDGGGAGTCPLTPSRAGRRTASGLDGESYRLPFEDFLCLRDLASSSHVLERLLAPASWFSPCVWKDFSLSPSIGLGRHHPTLSEHPYT